MGICQKECVWVFLTLGTQPTLCLFVYKVLQPKLRLWFAQWIIRPKVIHGEWHGGLPSRVRALLSWRLGAFVIFLFTDNSKHLFFLIIDGHEYSVFQSASLTFTDRSLSDSHFCVCSQKYLGGPEIQNVMPFKQGNQRGLFLFPCYLLAWHIYVHCPEVLFFLFLHLSSIEE